VEDQEEVAFRHHGPLSAGPGAKPFPEGLGKFPFAGQVRIRGVCHPQALLKSRRIEGKDECLGWEEVTGTRAGNRTGPAAARHGASASPIVFGTLSAVGEKTGRRVGCGCKNQVI
jgi:hypothetical protein